MWVGKVVVIFCVLFASGCCEVDNDEVQGLKILEHTITECTKSNESTTCFSEKAARAVERSMDWDIPLLDGMKLVRNSEQISHRQARVLGFDRLTQAIQNFFKTHVISFDLSEARKLSKKGDRDGGFEGFSGGGGYNQKQMKKEKKYMQYAFMVLLGIFGLTGPIVMKVLAMMAAKALLAAKAALIIVGSVALKKLFERDHHEPSVKVHHVNHGSHDNDDHDRISKFATGYGYESDSNNWQYYNNPYSGYYGDYYKDLNRQR